MLTMLRKGESGGCVRAETYQAMNVLEVLNDLAAEFELKKAVKMVIKF